MARDLKMVDATDDLAIENFDFVMVDGIDRVRQQIRIRLRIFLGEWFLDEDFGTPWFQEILGMKPVNLGLIENLLKEQILGVPNVTAVNNFVADYNPNGRRLSVNFEATTDFGTTGPITEVIPV